MRRDSLKYSTIWPGLAAVGVTTATMLFAVSGTSHAQTPSDDIPVVAQVRDAGPDLRDYVSPDLDPGEQAILRAAINNLPRATRERIASRPAGSVSFAVIDGTTNTIHYNRPEDIGSYEIVPALRLPGSEHPDLHPADEPNSDLDALSVTKDPGPYGGSGPYRRVYTIPVPAAQPPADSEEGPNYVQTGTVTTYCKSGTFVLGGTDRGYLYMGGWSPTWNTVSDDDATSAAVDAGLIYNYHASDISKDDYSMFINLGNKVAILSRGNGDPDKGDPAGTTTLPLHIGCSPLPRPVSAATTAQINFSIVPSPPLPSAAPECYEGEKGDFTWIGFPDQSCTTFAMILEVSSPNFEDPKNEIHSGMIIWVAPSVSEGGWAKTKKIISEYWNGKFNVPGYITDATCAGCIFKWMTSIAQKPEKLNDGIAFGAAWLNRGISAYAWGKNDGAVTPLTAGITHCSEYPLWHTPYPAKLSTDCTNTPSGLKGLAQTIQVRDFDTKGEWDIIELKY